MPSAEETAGRLTERLGYEHEATESDRERYRSATGGFGSAIDLVETDADYGQTGVGTVHHVAFRVADREAIEAQLPPVDGPSVSDD